MKLIATMSLNGDLTVPEEVCMSCGENLPDDATGWLQKHVQHGICTYPTGKWVCDKPECRRKVGAPCKTS